MDSRKHSSNKKDDSPMDTGSSEAPSSSTGQIPISSNQQELQTQSNPKRNSLRMDMIARDSNEIPISITELIRRNQIIFNLQTSTKPSSTNPSSLVDQPTQVNTPNPVLKSLLKELPNAPSTAINSTKRQSLPDLPEVETEIRPHVVTEAVAASTIQTLNQHSFSANKNPYASSSTSQSGKYSRICSPIEPNLNISKMPASKYRIIPQSTLHPLNQNGFTTTYKSYASSGAPHSERSSDICDPIKPRPDGFPTHASQAQILFYKPSASSGASNSERSSDICDPIKPRSNGFPTHASQAQILFYKPSASTGASHSVRSSDTSGPIEPRPDKFPVYASQAQILLQSVLIEIIQYNDENDRWRKFGLQFLVDSESGARDSGGDRGRDLNYYLAAMNTDWHRTQGQNMQRTRERMIATYTLETYEMLTSVVRAALVHISTGRLSGDFDGFILTHVNLRGLNETFSDYWKYTEIEAIEDEASRNDLKHFKKMIHRLLLASLMASKTFLMYIGENIEKAKMKVYETYLLDEEKTYLRRNP